jgi:hypothetical protein
MGSFRTGCQRYKLSQFISLPGLAVVFILCSFPACGGSRPPGASQLPAKINLSPGSGTSLQLGGTIVFTATAQNSSNANVNLTYTFQSSDTSILNIAPNGVACAGRWDAAFTVCTPQGTGVVQVTASAQGASSSPTFVFVHPPIDNITVTGILPANQTIQEPCLSQGQTMTVQARAFSQGADITASVGPFTWSANNPTVATLTPITNAAYNLATNQATATAVVPGITQIYAAASGVGSTSFQQPQYTTLINGTAQSSPVLDFFETCPIQNIALELGPAGSQQTGQTSFVTSKGTGQTITAVITDVMGNSSLANPNSITVLKNIPLTWTASQPAVVATSTSCTETCSASTSSPGAGSITASCSPPSCNVGFPQAPAILSSPACAQFFQLASCQQFIPLPVYATTAISGLVTGATSPATFVATSLACSGEAPAACNTSLYSMSTSRAVSNNPNPLPAQPNSFLFDLAGDKLYMGGAYGALVINPTNLGTQTTAFSALGSVTGKVLASSVNGNVALFSDTLHAPNQVYVVNTTNTTSPSASALNISGAVAAAFSRDGLKAFIIGCVASSVPCSSASGNALYVYSSLQALQGPIPLTLSANHIAMSTNDAFVYVTGDVSGTNSTLLAYNTCNSQLATTSALVDQIIPLSAPVVDFKVLPDGVHLIALDSTGTIDYITTTITGIAVAVPGQPAKSICPMFVSIAVPQSINLGQGTIHPVNLFTSADGTLLYVVASDRNSILVYDFSTGGVSGIQMLNNATPVSADITPDASTILIAGSDGMIHQVSTAAGGADMVQIQFTNLPNFSNPFCTINPTAGPCALNFVAARP